MIVGIEYISEMVKARTIMTSFLTSHTPTYHKIMIRAIFLKNRTTFLSEALKMVKKS